MVRLEVACVGRSPVGEPRHGRWRLISFSNETKRELDMKWSGRGFEVNQRYASLRRFPAAPLRLDREHDIKRIGLP